MTTHLKILLLQTRVPGDPVRAEERRSFAEKSGLQVDQVDTYDILQGPPTMAEARRYDALMIGGSGDYYVSDRSLPRFDAQMGFLNEAVAAGQPMFASCFGFQMLVEALGGEIIHDPDNTEVGTYELNLTGEGEQDPLLGSIPSTFAAQMGRKDRAARLPEGVVHLASSERSPFQAFRVAGKPIWSTQFHPELDRRTNLSRFERYMEGYAGKLPPRELDSVRERFRESPETERLLREFIRLVFE